MNGLFIDTATEQGSIALYKDDQLLHHEILSTQLNHLKVLHPTIEKMLKKRKVTLKEIDYFGVDIGPGSFTGIRIGVTAARTFAQTGNKYIFSAVSLDIISQSLTECKELICVILDGKKNRIFTAFYAFNKNSPQRISDYFDVEPEKLINMINKYKKKYNEVIFLGSGQDKYKEILKKINLKPTFTFEKNFFPLAKNIYYFMDKKKLSGDYEKIIPFYLRKSDAEEKKGIRS